MKKFTLLLSAMLLACATSLWAAESQTAVFDWTGSATEVKTATWSVTEQDITLTFDKGTNQSTPSPNKEGAVRMYTGTTLTISATEGCLITKVDFTHTTSGYPATNLQYQGKNLTSNSWTLETPANPIVLTASNNARFKKIVVTYTPAPTAPLTAIIISIPENVQLKKEYIVGTSFDVTGIQAIATYDGAPEEDVTEDVTWTIDPVTFESVAENTSVIVKASIGEMKSNELEITGITVRNLYNYTITWLDKNETFKTTTVTEGDALVLPATNPTCETKEFVGWTALETIPENATIEEMAFVDETTIPVADATYRAVFAKSQIVGAAEWQLVTTADDLKAGTKLLIASTSKNVVAGAIATGNTYMGTVAAHFADNVCTPEATGAVELTLGGTSAAWTLTNAEGQLLGATAVKKVAWGSGTTTWTISIDNNSNATIQNTTDANGRFLYNAKDTRFTTYTSNTSTNMLLPQLYKWGQSQSYSEFSFTCPSTPSDIEHVSAPATTVQKTIENGQLVILRDGVKYNAMGVRLQ